MNFLHQLSRIIEQYSELWNVLNHRLSVRQNDATKLVFLLDNVQLA